MKGGLRPIDAKNRVYGIRYCKMDDSVEHIAGVVASSSGRR